MARVAPPSRRRSGGSAALNRPEADLGTAGHAGETSHAGTAGGSTSQGHRASGVGWVEVEEDVIEIFDDDEAEAEADPGALSPRSEAQAQALSLLQDEAQLPTDSALKALYATAEAGNLDYLEWAERAQMWLCRAQERMVQENSMSQRGQQTGETSSRKRQATAEPASGPDTNAPKFGGISPRGAVAEEACDHGGRSSVGRGERGAEQAAGSSAHAAVERGGPAGEEGAPAVGGGGGNGEAAEKDDNDDKDEDGDDDEDGVEELRRCAREAAAMAVAQGLALSAGGGGGGEGVGEVAEKEVVIDGGAVVSAEDIQARNAEALQLLLAGKLPEHSARNALEEVEPQETAEDWAEAAQVWLARNKENEAEIAAHSAAMAQSLAEAQSRAVPLVDQSPKNLLVRFDGSNVLRQLGANALLTHLDIRHDLVAFLELERLCLRWYCGAAERYFSELASNWRHALRDAARNGAGSSSQAAGTSRRMESSQRKRQRLQRPGKEAARSPQQEGDEGRTSSPLFLGAEEITTAVQRRVQELLSEQTEAIRRGTARIDGEMPDLFAPFYTSEIIDLSMDEDTELEKGGAAE